MHSFHQSLELLGLLAIVCQFTQNKLNRSLVWGLGSIQWRAENLNMSLARFARNTHHSTRWVQVFRHEYISFIWLRESGCDLVKHTPTKNKYIPARCFTATFWHCGNQKPQGKAKCTFCSHPIQQTIDDCIKQGKLTAQAKSLAANARGLM